MKRGPGARGAVFALAVGLCCLSATAVWFFHAHGWQYLYGDAESHLNIARRITDSLTPRYEGVGTVWLPLPHWLMLPLARVDALWRNGMAGAIPSAICFVVGAMFFFAAARRVFQSTAAAVAAAMLLAVNPNLLYLQSTAMTEPVFLACLAGVLYGSVCFAESQGWVSVAGTGFAALAGTLTRYDGWFLIPFVAGYFLIVGKQRRIAAAAIFCAMAALGPLFWFGHNWWLTGDWLAFYRGPYSARAIQGGTAYPGLHNIRLAILYFAAAARLCAGPALAILGIAGTFAALARRVFWPVVLLALPGVFYIWSMDSSGATPVYVPTLWPFTWYNTRYGLAALPLLAFCAAALVAIAERLIDSRGILHAVRPWQAAALVMLAATVPWLVHPHPEAWITFQESRINSESRLQWTARAADYLAARYRPGSGIVTSSGDFNAIYRRAGIPLRDTLSVDNELLYLAPLARPDLLREKWAVVSANDLMQRSLLANGHYTLELRIVVKNSPPVEIYRR